MRERTEDIFACLMCFGLGEQAQTKKPKPAKRVMGVAAQSEKSNFSFLDNEIFSQLTFSNFGGEHVVKIFKQSFLKPDGLLDRSRFDWKFLNVLNDKIPAALGMPERRAFLTEMFRIVSRKFSETDREDYLEATVNNFLRGK
jgi:hypothetical protein